MPKDVCKRCPSNGDQCADLNAVINTFPYRYGLAAGTRARTRFDKEAKDLACEFGNIPIDAARTLVGKVGAGRHFGIESKQTLPEAVVDSVIRTDPKRFEPARDLLIDYAVGKFNRAVGVLGNDEDGRIRRYNFSCRLFRYVYQDLMWFASTDLPPARPEPEEGEDEDDAIDDLSDGGVGACAIQSAVLAGAWHGTMQSVSRYGREIVNRRPKGTPYRRPKRTPSPNSDTAMTGASFALLAA